MNLTIRYVDLSQEDIQTLKRDLGAHNVYFFHVGNATTITADGDLSEMLAILNITSKYRHSNLLLKE